VAYPLPLGVSGLIDPDDEPYIAILEECAAMRRRLGYPSYTRADIERLFAVKDIPAPVERLPANVLRLAARRRRRSRAPDGDG
jgi:hypothetical protein